MKKNETGKKENRLEKVVVFLLVVLISLLSFSVGVISGKGLSDKEYALKSVDQKYSHALNDGAAEEKSAEADLSEEEIQQLASAAIQAAEKNGGAEATEAHGDGEVAHVEKKAETKSTGHEAVASHSATSAGHAAVASHSATSTGHAAVASHSAINAGTHGASPIVEAPAAAHNTLAKKTTEDDSRSPTSVKRASLESEFTVQVASYPSLKDAETLSASLIKKGYPAFPFKVMIGGTEWYRVSVGSFKTRKEAMDYQGDLKKQGVVKDAVVQKLIK